AVAAGLARLTRRARTLGRRPGRAADHARRAPARVRQRIALLPRVARPVAARPGRRTGAFTPARLSGPARRRARALARRALALARAGRGAVHARRTARRLRRRIALLAGVDRAVAAGPGAGLDAGALVRRPGRDARLPRGASGGRRDGIAVLVDVDHAVAAARGPEGELDADERLHGLAVGMRDARVQVGAREGAPVVDVAARRLEAHVGEHPVRARGGALREPRRRVRERLIELRAPDRLRHQAARGRGQLVRLPQDDAALRALERG